MEQSREKLKVIDIEFKRNNTNKQTLFFDVIEHKFEDQFLVINYKEKPDNKDLKLFRVPHRDVIQLTRLVNGEQEGSWYEQER